MRDELVILRIEFRVVDAIQDSAKIMISGVQDAFEVLAVERCLDLLSIGRGNRCDRVGIYQSALQQVCILVCLQLVRCEIVFRQSGDRCDILRIPFALEPQIVDRHNRLDAAVEFIFLETALQIDRDQASLPVMAVDQIRAEAQCRKRAENRF